MSWSRAGAPRGFLSRGLVPISQVKKLTICGLKEQRRAGGRFSDLRHRPLLLESIETRSIRSREEGLLFDKVTCFWDFASVPS